MPLNSRTLLIAASLAVAGVPALAGGSAAGGASLAVTISGIKSSKGVIRLAVCPPAAGFPECKGHMVKAADLAIDKGKAHAVFSGLAPGSYAISVFHDANGNGRLDTFAGIPREGYGFSANPGFKPRAPRFDEAKIDLDGDAATEIRMRYIL
ncbi:uncharacterized protein (DUF2141 family) [Novosphingobium kunmingense]|uniref:Uncharacterized protein (DUF2141 family) n=2 Tax=Novosphingobium kunmingense TaxID=1211806 RepID=A0A2N0I493_9SPHN|nr:uncharacterized protein (DUF2141 family) [Novosphingobium kunmingense]